MVPFEPGYRLQKLQERLDGLVNQIDAVAGKEIARRLELIAALWPNHEFAFCCAMGSRSVSVSPPLVSNDGQHSVEALLDHDINDRRRWHGDAGLSRFADHVAEIFAVDDWLCQATRVNSSELGSIARGWKKVDRWKLMLMAMVPAE